MRHDKRVARRVVGADIDHGPWPVSFADALGAAQDCRPAAVALQLAGLWDGAGPASICFVFHSQNLQKAKKAGRLPKKDNTESSAGIVGSHPAIDSVLYFSSLPATYFRHKTCALWIRPCSGSVTISCRTFSRSDAEAPRHIESLSTASCYNKIIA